MLKRFVKRVLIACSIIGSWSEGFLPKKGAKDKGGLSLAPLSYCFMTRFDVQ